MRELSWVKGHGTENDFVLVHDPDGRAYDWLDAEAIRRVCDRRRGVGADGVLRVVRADAIADGLPYAGQATWFMDFSNADGTAGEMCGNGVRVFTRYLAETGLIEPGKTGGGSSAGAGNGTVVPIATRAGLKPVRFEAGGELLTVDMGTPGFPESAGLMITVHPGGVARPGVAVDMGNPHAVVQVEDLTDAGPLLDPPSWAPADVFPAGVNVEFAVRRGPDHLAMRVHERGVGETRSCGTGACVVAAVAARQDRREPPWRYRVDVPGGTLAITGLPDGRVEMTGPAVLTARGVIAV